MALSVDANVSTSSAATSGLNLGAKTTIINGGAGSSSVVPDYIQAHLSGLPASKASSKSNGLMWATGGVVVLVLLYLAKAKG